MLDQITPLILTLDEAPNIGRVLDRLSWAKDVVVVDSFSKDETADIVKNYPNTRLFQRKFDQHADQWNFGLRETSIRTEWILALDADFVVPEDVVQELTTLVPPLQIGGYRAAFRYCIQGRPLRNAVYPPVTVLFRRARAKYFQDGHTQRVRVEGELSSLAHPLLHDDRKTLRRWLRSQVRYMKLESAKLAKSRFSDLALKDKVRRLLVIAPLGMLIYCLFGKGNILDGRAGLVYALQRSTAEAILSLYLLRATVSRR